MTRTQPQPPTTGEPPEPQWRTFGTNGVECVRCGTVLALQEGWDVQSGHVCPPEPPDSEMVTGHWYATRTTGEPTVTPTQTVAASDFAAVVLQRDRAEDLVLMYQEELSKARAALASVASSETAGLREELDRLYRLIVSYADLTHRVVKESGDWREISNEWSLVVAQARAALTPVAGSASEVDR